MQDFRLADSDLRTGLPSRVYSIDLFRRRTVQVAQHYMISYTTGLISGFLASCGFRGFSARHRTDYGIAKGWTPTNTKATAGEQQDLIWAWSLQH